MLLAWVPRWDIFGTGERCGIVPLILDLHMLFNSWFFSFAHAVVTTSPGHADLHPVTFTQGISSSIRIVDALAIKNLFLCS